MHENAGLWLADVFRERGIGMYVSRDAQFVRPDLHRTDWSFIVQNSLSWP